MQNQVQLEAVSSDHGYQRTGPGKGENHAPQWQKHHPTMGQHLKKNDLPWTGPMSIQYVGTILGRWANATLA